MIKEKHAKKKKQDLHTDCTITHKSLSESDDNSSFSDESNRSSPHVQYDHSPDSDIAKKFPPPNPLPPKSLLTPSEPLHIGGNIHFL